MTTVGARSMTWCSATSPPRRATTTSGGTSRSASPAPADVGQQHAAGVEAGSGGTTGVRHDEPAVGGVAGSGGLARHLHHDELGAGAGGEADDREHPAVAGLAGGEVHQPRPLRARHQHPRGGRVGEPAGDDLALPEEGYGARHPPQPGAVGGHDEHRAPALERTVSEDSVTTCGSMPGTSSMPCSASSARLSESSTSTSVGPGIRRSWRGCGHGPARAPSGPLLERGGQRVLHERVGAGARASRG